MMIAPRASCCLWSQVVCVVFFFSSSYDSISCWHWFQELAGPGSSFGDPLHLESLALSVFTA